MAKIVMEEGGRFTLPDEVRVEMGLQADSVLEITQLNKGAFLLSRPRRMDEIGSELEADMKSRGLTLDDVLAELKVIWKERYGRKLKEI